MRYRQLGRSGLTVSRVGLGCGNFGGVGSAPELFGQGESEEQAFAIMDAAWSAGINFFDTAASYGGGRSEAWVGRWREDRRADVLVSTKVYWSASGDPAAIGTSSVPMRIVLPLILSARRR